MVISGFDLLGGIGEKLIITDKILKGIKSCYTNNNIIIVENIISSSVFIPTIQIYDKKTGNLKRSVPSEDFGSSDRLYGLDNRISIVKHIDSSNSNLLIYDENFNLIKTITFQYKRIFGYGSDGTYIYITSGSHGRTDATLSKYDLNGNLVRQSETWYTFNSQCELIAIDESYVYHVTTTKKIVKRDKNTFSKIYEITIPLNGGYDYGKQLFVFKDFLYLNTDSSGTPVSTSKLKKSDGTLVSQRITPIIGVSKNNIYGFGSATPNTYSTIAMDDNFNIIRSLPIGYYGNIEYAFDKTATAEYPTFLNFNKENGLNIEIIDLGGEI